MQNNIMDGGAANMFAAVDRCQDVDEAVRMVKQIVALKAALDSVNAFHEKALLYARLEAEALIRVIDLNGISKLRGDLRATADWLWGLSDDEREKYVAMCAEGLTIVQVYKREVKEPRAIVASLGTIAVMRDELVTKLQEDGAVDISAYSYLVRNSGVASDVAEDIIDGARHALRRAGGVGIGEDGTYVLPERGGEEVKKAVLLRYQSICADMARIAEIQEAADLTMSFREIDSHVATLAYKKRGGYMIHVLIALARMGLISDYEEMLMDISNSEVQESIYNTVRDLKLSRKNIITALYKEEVGGDAE